MHLLVMSLFLTSSPAEVAPVAPVGADMTALAIPVDVAPVSAAPEPPAEDTPAVLPRRQSTRPRRARRPAIVAPAAAWAPEPPSKLPDVAPDVAPTSPSEVTATSPVPPPVAAPAAATAPEIFHISPATARGLRIEDEFPGWPAGLRRGPTPSAVMLEVCVSELGVVRDVRINSPTDELLRRTLDAAIRRWRYRALMMGGHARPFCHPVRIEYRVG